MADETSHLAGWAPERTPHVSVVIVTLDEGEYLRRTVEAMRATTPPGTELVVVDDGSTDGSLDFLAGIPEVVVSRPAGRLGIAAARNHGARLSTGEVLVFSDAHVLPSPGWLPPVLEALSDPAVGEVTTAIGHLGNDSPALGYGFTWGDLSLRMRWLQAESGGRPTGAEVGGAGAGTRTGAGTRALEVPFICGCFLAMRRGVFEEVGGFDQGMYRWGSEDAELSLRLWTLGYQCRCIPSVSARHLFRDSFPYEVDQSGVLANTLRMSVLHLDGPALDRVVRHHARRPIFGRAWATVLDGDAWQRRKELDGRRRRNARSFIRHFGIDVLA